MSLPTRREFLHHGSMAVVGLALTKLPANPRDMLSAVVKKRTGRAVEESIDGASLRQLAGVAIETMRKAGVSYGDIRLAQQYTLFAQGSIVESSLVYGARILVDGTWEFAHGSTLTADAISHAVQRAVLRGRDYAKVSPGNVELAPAPVIVDSWTSPLQIDPFSVPIRDQLDRFGALLAAITRVDGVYSLLSSAGFSWEEELRVFASTEGSVTTQMMRRAKGGAHIATTTGYARSLPGMATRFAGFETALDPTLEERLKAFAEETVELGKLPLRDMDVGRYPAVFDGVSMGGLVSQTLSAALELDRALQDEADGVGTSWLSPPEQMLGTNVVPACVNLTSDLHTAGSVATPWDDEGVARESFSLISKGQIVDYLTTRSTAPALAKWYTSQGWRVRSHGCAVSPVPDRMPLVAASSVALAADPSSHDVGGFVREIRQGVLVTDMGSSVDFGLASGTLGGNGPGALWCIEKGKITHRIDHAAIQFQTRRLWSALSAVGNTSTSAVIEAGTEKDQPPHGFPQTVRAPAGFFSAVDLINTARRI